MKNNKLMSFLIILNLVLMIFSSSAIAVVKNNPGVAPFNSKPHHHNYGEWAAKFWQWALEYPVTNHPVLDQTGQYCSNGQKGTVWFLSGDFGGSSPINRTCSIPSGQALFFPIIDAYYGAFLNDPPETRTPEFLRSMVDCSVSKAKVVIDGVSIKNIYQYYVSSKQSPLFDVQLPIDNVFELDETVVPELLLSPSVTSGLFLFLSPLSVGLHHLHWEAEQTCPFGNFTQNITYTLNILPHNYKTSSGVLIQQNPGIYLP